MDSDWPIQAGFDTPPLDGVNVWAVSIDSMAARQVAVAANLSAEEQERAAQFRLEEPRLRYVATRSALKTLLARYLGRPASELKLENDANGKPRLAAGRDEADIRFNVAHSGNLALIAFAVGCEVGVDVEQLRVIGRVEQIAQRFFHPEEADAILATAAGNRNESFLRFWTAKEAVLKAIGCGVTGSLSSFRVRSMDANPFQAIAVELPPQLSPHQPRCWLSELTPCLNYVGAVAWLGAGRTVRQFWLESDAIWH